MLFLANFTVMPDSQDPSTIEPIKQPTEAAATASSVPTPPAQQVQPPDLPLAPSQPVSRPLEVGGREGPEPTRFGDWEYRGRCIDF